MSVEPQALERSVLERKERDELAAIAEAMGVKAGARTSKANLIGQILREAGIETGEDKPKRASKPKPGNATTNGEAVEAADEAAADDEAPDDDADAASEAREGREEQAPAAEQETEASDTPAAEQAEAQT